MKPVRLDAQARDEALEAAATYEQARETWGDKFLDELEERLEFIELNPELPPDFSGERGLKRVQMRRFPFWVVYRILPEEIHVVAVAHQRRKPGYWRDRDS